MPTDADHERNHEEEETKEGQVGATYPLPTTSKRPPLGTKVVSGMPYRTTEDQIRRLLEKAGGRSRCFSSPPSPTPATSSVSPSSPSGNGRLTKVERCRMNPRRKWKSEFCHKPQKVEGCFSAYVGNFSWNTTENDIVEFFNTSKITSIRFAQDKRTGAFRGFGHIEFADNKLLEEAIKKNQLEL